MTQLLANNVGTTLSGAQLATDTVLNVVSASGFPIPGAGTYFYMTLADPGEDTWEIVKVTGVSGTAFTVTRAQDGTTALPWAAGSTVEMRPTAQSLRDIQNAAYARAMALSVAMG